LNALFHREGALITSFTIQNIVASANLGAEIDLNHLSNVMAGADYNPENFPGLVFRQKNPKTATLIFSSGKIVCTGSKTIKQLYQSIENVIGCIIKAGIPVVSSPKIDVQNIVASSDLGHSVNLVSIVLALGMQHVEYEPEVFPGLVYRLDDPKVVILLFGSGRLVCTGARKAKDVKRAVERIAEELRSAELL
jgi:transcription initiation factor TFIID TATA-box-binding protein